MKWIKLFAAVVMLFGICCVAQTSPIASSKTVSSSAGYTLTLASLPNSIQIGLPVNITVTVKNVTDADIYWSWDKGKDMAYKGFRFLLMKDGREVETTVFHRKITGRQRQDDPVELGPSSSVAIPYPPGTMFTMTIDLNKLYEITEPGEYTLDVSRTEDDGKTTVHSNTVTLNIVP